MSFDKNQRKNTFYPLTDSGKVCYYNSMEENTLMINKKIGQNSAYFRKRAGLTQAELAEKINYSDKSVSKWESGGGAPDVYILMQLAEIFQVTVNDLLGDEPKKDVGVKSNRGLHLLIMALSIGLAWLAATFVFVLLNMIPGAEGDFWLTFIFALPVNAIILIVFSGIWQYRRLNVVAVTMTIWTSILSLYCVLRYIVDFGPSSWEVFLLGIPLQILEMLWFVLRYSNRRGKKSV